MVGLPLVKTCTVNGIIHGIIKNGILKLTVIVNAIPSGKRLQFAIENGSFSSLI